MNEASADLLELFVTLRASLVAIQRCLLEIPGTNKLHGRLVSDICERVNELEAVLIAVLKREMVLR